MDGENQERNPERRAFLRTHKEEAVGGKAKRQQDFKSIALLVARLTSRLRPFKKSRIDLYISECLARNSASASMVATALSASPNSGNTNERSSLLLPNSLIRLIKALGSAARYSMTTEPVIGFTSTRRTPASCEVAS